MKSILILSSRGADGGERTPEPHGPVLPTGDHLVPVVRDRDTVDVVGMSLQASYLLLRLGVPNVDFVVAAGSVDQPLLSAIGVRRKRAEENRDRCTLVTATPLVSVGYSLFLNV